MIVQARETDWAALTAPGQRWLCVDVGDTTLGVALSDSTRLVASPLLTLARKSMAKDSQALAELLAQHAVGLCILGWPVNLNGTEGPQCQKVMSFAKRLAKLIQIPIVLWDERWTTRAVERMMITADLSRRRRDQLVDQLAACYLLQGVLDYVRLQPHLQPPAPLGS